MLRQAPTPPSVPSMTLVPELSNSPTEPTETTQLKAQVEVLGDRSARRQRCMVEELAISLAAQMRSRAGAEVYQTLVFSFSALRLPGAGSTSHILGVWTAKSVSELTTLIYCLVFCLD